MRRFENKVALVTGGRSGIGRAIARRLHDEGATVLTAQRGPDDEYDSIPADFSDTASPDRVIAEVIERAGRLDVLVNNAGMLQEAAVEDMSLEDWQCNLTVNLTAPFLMIRAALPHLRATRGSIVNVGSTEGLGANPHHASYCATKAGLHGLTRAVAVDHGHEGIRCNAVAPGWIDTESTLSSSRTCRIGPHSAATSGASTRWPVPASRRRSPRSWPSSPPRRPASSPGTFIWWMAVGWPN
jgi:meso-butanediol dehydrogenase/(S,S)-butanediol dehydrogenase/diacetyl reductase